jgi:bacillithiol biosynthesis deacetylase BshB1
MTDIVAFGAHPDDIEFGCGGILAKASAQGYKVLMVDLTLGDKATNGSPEERRQEGEASAALIGAKRIFLNFRDCEVFDTYEGRLELVRVLREYQPRLILGPMWEGTLNHPDHLALGQMLRHACRYARFANILPELPAYRPEGILHYLPQDGFTPDFIVDVSEQAEKWKQMMLCHKSQHRTFPYSDWLLRHAAKTGDSIGVAYAQGLKAGNPVEIQDVMSVARATREI